MHSQTSWFHVETPASQIHAIYRNLTDTTSIYWPATVRDLTTTAIRLIVPRPIRPGRLMSLRMSCPRDMTPVTRLVSVVGFQAHGPTWQVVGLFTESLTEDELHQLLPEAILPHETVSSAR